MAGCKNNSKKLKEKKVTIEDLVAIYNEKHKPIFDEDLKRCSNAENVFNHSHQYNVNKIAKAKASAKLQKDNLWNKNYQSFEDVYDSVKNSIGGIKGIGCLTVYDVSLRISVSKKIYPKENVYLSRGAKEGLVCLIKIILEKVVDVAVRKLLESLLHKPIIILTKTLLNLLLKYFPILKIFTPMYLEDFLCISKEGLKNLK